MVAVEKDSDKGKEWRKKKYTVATVGSQVDIFTETTKAIGEYVGREFGSAMKKLVLHEKEAVFEIPSLPEKPTEQDKLQWSIDYKTITADKKTYEEQKTKVFGIIFEQCDETMKQCVESHSLYAEADEISDVLTLLSMIRESAYDANTQQYPPRQAAMAWKHMASVHQQHDESLVAYYKRFLEVVERVERFYGPIVPSVLAEKEKGKKDEKDAKAREQVLAILFMEGAVKGFKPMLRNLERDYSLGASMYPVTVDEALKALKMEERQPVYKAIMKKLKKKITISDEDDDNAGLSFAMSKMEMMRKGMCFKCGKQGHKAVDCTKKEDEEGGDGTQQGHVNTQIVSWAG